MGNSSPQRFIQPKISRRPEMWERPAIREQPGIPEGPEMQGVLVDVDVSASRQLNHEEAGESSRPKIALDLVGSKRESLTVLSIAFLKAILYALSRGSVVANTKLSLVTLVVVNLSPLMVSA
jgi:hypothetical protein